MKRKDFLRKLGIGVATAVIAPQVLAEMPDKVEELKTVEFKPKTMPTNAKVSDEFVSGFSSVYETMLKQDVYKEYVKHYKKVHMLVFLSL